MKTRVSFSINEMLADLKVLSAMPDSKTKKELSNKYSFNSNKSAEIQHEIYRLLNELHKDRTTFTADDVKWFDEYWDFPSSPQKLKEAFREESDEFLEFYRQAEYSRFKAFSPSSIRSMSYKSLERKLKVLTGLRNERKNSSDILLKNLIANLNNVTKPFHDNYIKKVIIWHTEWYDNLIQMKDFYKPDYMAFFGTASESEYEYIKEQMEKRWGNSLKSSERDMWYEYHSEASEEFISDKKPIKLFGVDYAPNVVRIAIHSHYRKTENSVHSDLPSKKALDMRKHVSQISAYKSKGNYIVAQKIQAEHQYQSNIALVADRVRKMQMNESNLSVEKIREDAKGFDIMVTDGVKRVHARSIWAAEGSCYVSPHFRFIITDKTNK